MSMKLYVEMLNDGAAICGIDMPISRRIVAIELTEEQVKKLQPKWIATVAGKEHFETVRLIAIQQEEP